MGNDRLDASFVFPDQKTGGLSFSSLSALGELCGCAEWGDLVVELGGRRSLVVSIGIGIARGYFLMKRDRFAVGSRTSLYRGSPLFIAE